MVTKKKPAPKTKTKALSFDNEGLTGWQNLLARHSITGCPITRETALSIGSVYRATDLISSKISSCDCIVYRQGENNSITPAQDHDAYALLYRFANPITTAETLVSNLVASAILHGNGFAWIERDDRGRVVNLWNLDSEAVSVVVLYRDNLAPEISYAATGIGTHGSTALFPLRADEIIHLKSLGNPYCGKGLLNVARETLGLATTAQNFASFYIENSGILQTIVELGEFATEEQKTDYKRQFEANHRGINNAFRPCFVPPETKVTTLSVNADEFALDQLSDRLDRAVANFTGLPPHKVAVPGVGSSYGSIDAENQSILSDCYGKWFTRLENELTLKLCTEFEKRTGKVFIAFDRMSLLESEPDKKTARWVSLYSADLVTREEVRFALDMPTVATGEYKSDSAPEPAPQIPQESNANQPPNQTDNKQEPDADQTENDE